MKKTIRSSCFETNSSSMHSIVVKKEGRSYSQEEMRKHVWICKDGTYNFWPKTYGRSPFRCLSTFAEKWSYCMADYGAWTDSFDELDELISIFYKYFPETKNIWFDKKQIGNM